MFWAIPISVKISRQNIVQCVQLCRRRRRRRRRRRCRGYQSEHGHEYLVMFLSRLEMRFFSSPFFCSTLGNENQIPNYFYRELTQRWKVNYHLSIY